MLQHLTFEHLVLQLNHHVLKAIDYIFPKQHHIQTNFLNYFRSLNLHFHGAQSCAPIVSIGLHLKMVQDYFELLSNFQVHVDYPANF